MINGRQPGDNITLLNNSYKRVYIQDANEYTDYMVLVYKDLDTGIKYKEEIECPDYEYYVARPDKRTNYNRSFIPIEDAVAVKTPYYDLEKEIACRFNKENYFYENIRNGNRSDNKKLHLHPDLFNSDMNIEDHYRFRFDKLYKNQYFVPYKSYFDIEVDTIHLRDIGKDFPDPGECPVNAITAIFQDTKEVYTFLLKSKENIDQINEFENFVKSGKVFNDLADFIYYAVDGEELYTKYGLDFKFNFLFYNEEDEINLIADFFKAINTFKPDFVLAWNMGFDIPYLIERIKKLGYRPEDIMCHTDFKIKSAYYFVDERNKSETAERGDFAMISSYSVYLDQMIQFASRRKNNNRLLSNSLDFVGQAIAKVRKLDYKDITTSISELPYKSYKTFVYYNIMDTIVQYCIEHQTEDINYTFGKVINNNTRYSKIHRQTVYLANRGAKEFYKNGFIIGNNVNKFNEKPSEKYPGAFVADPRKLNNYSKLMIYGRFSEIIDNIIDEDFASLYPSILREFNMAAHTQIGYIDIPKMVHRFEDKAKTEHWIRSGEFIENIQSQVWLEFNSRWFNLPNYTEMYHMIERFFETEATAIYGLREKTRDNLINPFIYNGGKFIQPMEFEDTRRHVDESMYNYPNINKWESWRNNALANPNQLFGTTSNY